MRKIDVALLEDFSQRKSPEKLPVAADNSVRPSYSHKTAMSPALVHILNEVQRELGMLGAEADAEELPSSNEISALIQQVAGRLGLEITHYERDRVLEYIENEQKPFGLLQELVDNSQISDIIVTSYSKVSVQQGRKNYTTDISFPSREAYEAYVERLLKKAGSTYSTKKPIADGMVGSFARVHVVHRALCETGPYLTIRLNRFSSVSTNDLVKAGLAPVDVFRYLRALITTGQTLLIAGEVGTGKTTLARALASTIPMDESVLVIEDTPEIMLEHPHVRYVRTREANVEGMGKVSPSECIRGGMRMAMNRIIFGEIRDAEAAESFIDVCASGHPGLSTIHSRSAAEAVTRLELFLGRAQKGVETAVLSQQVSTAVQVIVHIDICRYTGRRRIMQVREVGAIADGVMRQKDIFLYRPQNGIPSWRVNHKISDFRDLIEELEEPVVLSSLPSQLELATDVSYNEAAFAAVR